MNTYASLNIPPIDTLSLNHPQHNFPQIINIQYSGIIKKCYGRATNRYECATNVLRAHLFFLNLCLRLSLIRYMDKMTIKWLQTIPILSFRKYGSTVTSWVSNKQTYFYSIAVEGLSFHLASQLFKATRITFKLFSRMKTEYLGNVCPVDILARRGLLLTRGFGRSYS